MLLGALSACNPLGEFKSYPFARIADSGSDISVKEDGGDVVIPIATYNAEGLSGTVAFKVTNVAGEASNYSVEPSSGVLSFSGNTTQNITVKVKNNPGKYTGNTTLNIELVSATGDITIGAPRGLSITILDNDIPVDWKFIEGTWTAQDYDGAAKDGGTYEVEVKKVDDTTVNLINLWGGGETLEGTIEFDEATNSTTMAFKAQQVVFDATAYGYGPMILIGVDETGAWNWVPTIAKVTPAGITVGPWNMVITQGDYKGYLYGGSYTTILTR